ncbi:hypothetical protein [Streptomyces sp. NPDC051183]|uniref:hypothetical protein n=1 Tax=unclassified Streptomyces TaxID=2593676 RepID=UPI00344AB1B1
MAQNEGGRPGVSDEEWAQFVEQAERGAGEAPKEPSARARMVTERLRREEEQRAEGQKKRFGRAKPVSAEPPGWRTGPAWQEMDGRGTAKRRLKATLAVVLIAGLALIVVRPELLIDKVTGKAGQDAGAGVPLAPETARPTAAPPESYPDRPTLQDPFKGSPALQWADGAAGIEVPEATAVGGMSKEQVADALAKTRQFLIAANLDAATLRGERPAAALALLDPRQPEVPGRLERSLTHPSAEDTPVELFTRFDPAEVTPVGDVVKVRGSMRAEPGERGELLVVADYTFVHPLTKGGASVQRTIVRRQVTLALLDPARWETTRGRLQARSYTAEWSNVECEAADGFLHPYFPQDVADGPEPTGPASDPYDRSQDIKGEGCGTITRS